MKFKFRYIISKGKLILCNKIMRICNFHADSLAEKKNECIWSRRAMSTSSKEQFWFSSDDLPNLVKTTIIQMPDVVHTCIFLK